MLKHTQMQRLMFLFALAGFVAIAADFACIPDVCADLRTGEYKSMEQIQRDRVLTLGEALKSLKMELTATQQLQLARDGHLNGIVKPGRPVKHPDGSVEMPANWLPALPAGHPWLGKLTPADDAYYSFVEERIFKAQLYDETNPDHVLAAQAYLAKVHSAAPEFTGWTAGTATMLECKKKMYDAKGVGVVNDGGDAK